MELNLLLEWGTKGVGMARGEVPSSEKGNESHYGAGECTERARPANCSAQLEPGIWKENPINDAMECLIKSGIMRQVWVCLNMR